MLKPIEQIRLLDKLTDKMDVDAAIATYCATMATVEFMHLFTPEV